MRGSERCLWNGTACCQTGEGEGMKEDSNTIPILGQWRMEPSHKWLGKYKMYKTVLMTHLLRPQDLWSGVFNTILILSFLSMSDWNEVSTLIIKEASFLLCTLNQCLSQWFYTRVVFLEYTGKLGICLLFTSSNLVWNVLQGLLNCNGSLISNPQLSYSYLHECSIWSTQFWFWEIDFMKTAYWKYMKLFKIYSLYIWNNA